MKGKNDVEVKVRSIDLEVLSAKRSDGNFNYKATLGCPWSTVRFVTVLV